MGDFSSMFFMVMFWMVGAIYSRTVIENPALGALCQFGVGLSIGFIVLEIAWMLGSWVWRRLKKEFRRK